jgi:hypothetical protein
LAVSLISDVYDASLRCCHLTLYPLASHLSAVSLPATCPLEQELGTSNSQVLVDLTIQLRHIPSALSSADVNTTAVAALAKPPTARPKTAPPPSNRSELFQMAPRDGGPATSRRNLRLSQPSSKGRSRPQRRAPCFSWPTLQNSQPYEG